MADKPGGNDADQASSDQKFGVAAPQLSLPKGGGAVRGIGEKFAANPVTGTGSMSVPIATSPGRSGFGPQLSLSYDSGAGNGPFGFGWSLNAVRLSSFALSLSKGEWASTSSARTANRTVLAPDHVPRVYGLDTS